MVAGPPIRKVLAGKRAQIERRKLRASQDLDQPFANQQRSLDIECRLFRFRGICSTLPTRKTVIINQN